MNLLFWLSVGFVILYIAYHLCYIRFQHYFIFRPEKLPKDFQFIGHAPLQEFKIPVDDVSLNAVMLSPPSSQGIILYFHGNMRHLQNYLPYTIPFTEMGYRLFIPDYRSYGKSEGTLTEENFYADALLMYDWLHAKFPGEKILVYGRSLGTAAAAYVASHRDPVQLILEAPFYNMYDVSKWYGLFLPPGNYLSYGFRTDLMVSQVNCRIMLIHGTKDRIVPVGASRKLSRFLKPGDQYIEIQKGNHHNLHQFELYHETIRKALESAVNVQT